MRKSLAVLSFVALIPAKAFADDLPVAPPPPVVQPVVQQAGIDRTFPATNPVVQQQAPRIVTAPETVEQPPEGGYVKPHIVPYMGGSIPQSAHIETHPNWGLTGAGVGVLALSYSISLFYALGTCGAQMDCRAGSGWLYLPLVGPFITAAQSETTGGAALAAFDGGVQILGATLALAGVIAPKKFVVWQDKTAKLSVAPIMPGHGTSAGFALTLTNL